MMMLTISFLQTHIFLPIILSSKRAKDLYKIEMK